MLIKHIEKRVRVSTRTAPGSVVKVTAQCGAPVGKKAWTAQDARDMFRLIREGNTPRQYSKTWEFCDGCVKAIK